MPPHVPGRVPVRRGSPVLQAPGLRPRSASCAPRAKNFRSTEHQAGRLDDHAADHQADAARRRGRRSVRPRLLAERSSNARKKTQKYKRKMKEVILAVRLERELTKAEILSIYLNHVYLGHGAYGVGAAAETYFGKEVEDLTIAEAAMLAGLVASPTKYAPHRNMQLARERQRYVLGHMREDQYISDAEYEAALAEPIALVDESDLNHLASPYFVEHVRQLATKRYGNTELFRGGLGSTRRSTPACRRPPRARCARASSRSIAGSASAARSAASRKAQRGAWTGGPAHPLTGATDDTTRARRPAAARAALRRDDRRADQAGRRDRRSRPASGCRSSTPTPRTSARGAARRQAGTVDETKSSARRPAAGPALGRRQRRDARAAPRAAGLDGRDRAEHRPRASRWSAATTGPRRSSIARPRPSARSARRSSRSSTRRRSRPARRPSITCTTARSR